MTAESNVAEFSTMESAPEQSDEIQSADVINLFPPELDALHADELTDLECIDLFASIWLHPSVTNTQLAERIANDLARSEDEWHKRLNTIRDKSPFIEFYDEAMNDATFSEIVDFLSTTKNERDKYEYERAAAKALADFCVRALTEGESTEKLGRVFAKMPR